MKQTFKPLTSAFVVLAASRSWQGCYNRRAGVKRGVSLPISIRVGSWQKGFLRGFVFLGRRIFLRILSPDFFSSFLWEKVPRKILHENRRQILQSSKFDTTKIPDTFCRGAGSNIQEQTSKSCKKGKGRQNRAPSRLEPRVFF